MSKKKRQRLMADVRYWADRLTKHGPDGGAIQEFDQAVRRLYRHLLKKGYDE